MYDSEEFSEAFEDLASPFVNSRAAGRCKCQSRGTEETTETEGSEETETEFGYETEGEWEDERRKRRRRRKKTAAPAPAPPGTDGTEGTEGSDGSGTAGSEGSVETSGESWEAEGEWEEPFGEFEGEAPYDEAEFEFEEAFEDETAPADLRSRIAAIARQEWQRWGQGTRSEKEPAMRPALRTYWQAVVTPSVVESQIDAGEAWSAAFVSYVMRTAGAGSAFTGEAAHFKYIRHAKRARANGDASKYQAYRLTEAKPEVGDVLCRDRTVNGKCGGTEFDNVSKGTYHATHCDVVTEVRSGKLTVIGGNVGGKQCPKSGCTVNARTVKLDARGFVIAAPGGCRYFAILKAPSSVAAVVPAAAPVAAPAAMRPVAAPAGGFLKDLAELKTVALAPTQPIGVNRQWPSARKAAAATYNRVGELMGALATRLGVELQAVLAVWRVESGGRTHTPGKAIIRFENHLLFRLWGSRNPARYNVHFRHGGHAGQGGKSWEGHQLRASATDQFTPIHTGSQGNEYRALELATRLAGEGIALQCISIGGPQILISNHRRLGYATPRQMYDAFQASERWQVIGFFDFCRNTKQGQLVAYLRARDWAKFAYYYNGKGQVAKYSGHLTDAYQTAQAVALVPAREFESEEEEQGEGEVEMEWENDPLSETWETAPESEWEWEDGKIV